MSILSLFKKREREPAITMSISEVVDRGYGWRIDVACSGGVTRRFFMPKVHPYNSVVFPTPFVGAPVRGGYMLRYTTLQMWYVLMDGKWWSVPALLGME